VRQDYDKEIHHSKMQTLVKIFYSLLKQLIVFLILTTQCFNFSIAASQGKRSIQSSASVEISVTVNQTLTAVTPPELLLKNAKQSRLVINSPFCIAHHGFSKNAVVPYDLIVDSLVSTNDNQSEFPFKIFLENKKQKQLLTNGTSLAKQSQLNINENLIYDCENSGAYLSIEQDSNILTPTPHIGSTGLLILLVSPN
jgi:hypothetical protein